MIGLQEVWACGGENLAGWLASNLDMHWTWAPSRASQRWQRRLGDSTVDVGNAVLCRLLIAEHDMVELPARPGQVFLDAWEYADPAQASATWNAANPYIAAGFEPSVRIDYIHIGPPGPEGLGSVRSVRRVGDEPVDGVWPSDHAAVLADLRDPSVR